MTEPPSWMLHIMQFIVGALGGGTKYLHEFQKTGAFNWRLFASSLMAAGFVGWVFAQLALIYFPAMAIVSAAIGGYGGGKMMEMVVEYMTKRVGKVLGEDEK